MARRKRLLDDAAVAALPVKAARYSHPDNDQRGLFIRVTPKGARSFVAVARGPNGRQVWHTIGATTDLGIETAREQAKVAIRLIKAGLPAVEPPAPEASAGSFAEVAEAWLTAAVDGRHRTAKETRRIIAVYVLPQWADRKFIDIKKSDVAALLDVVEKRGARQADAVLTVLRSLMGWYESRSDDYVIPLGRRMRRDTAPPRARVLDDAEVRAVWQHATGTFGNLVKFALLTGQRRQKLSELRWDDLVETPTGVEWRIPAERREKGHAGALVLPQFALDVIAAQPRLVSNPFVFSGRGHAAFNSYSDAKDTLDAKVQIAPWVFHDLRRTARSLMSRANVRPDIAERVLGHIQPGIVGVYDRHTYRDEKAAALQSLAALIARILDPPTNNVVPLVREGAEAS